MKTKKKKVVISAHIDKKLKDEAQKILNALGLNMSRALEIYMERIVLERGIPFMVKLPDNYKIRKKS